jgi:ATP-binding cassette, subfamily B, bacterial CvaB/MchF/RaxB
MSANAEALETLSFNRRRRVPLVRQSEAAECGIACLAMIASHHGPTVTLSQMRRQFPVSLQGVSLSTLIDCASALGYSTRPLRGEIHELPEVKLPAILHWDLNHFVVLAAIKQGLSGQTYTVLDPARGEVNYSEAELSRHWTGVVLEFMAHNKNVAALPPARPLRLSELGFSLEGLKGLFGQAIALSVLLQLFALLTPFYLQTAIDSVLPALDRPFLVALALGFAALAVINALTQILRDTILIKVGSAAGFSMMSRLFRHMLNLPVGFFERRHTGDVISRFGSTGPINRMLTERLMGGLIDGIMGVLTLALMFYYSPMLTLVSLGFLFVFLVFRLLTYRPLKNASKDSIAAHAEESSAMIETVRGMPTIKIFGGAIDRMRLWQNKRADAVNADMRVARMEAWFSTVSDVILKLETVAFVFLAVNMVMQNSFTVGMIFAFQAYKRQFLGAAMTLVDTALDFRMLSMHMERIADIAHEPPEQAQPAQSRMGRPDFKGGIDLRNVSFSYGIGSEKVLDDVSLSIKPGESVAIIGPSGGGKTTLMKLLLGVYEPTSGEVLVDGQKLTQYGLDAYRGRIGAVMQDDVLYAGSIAENIAFFDQTMDMDLVIHCAQAAHIHDDIMKLPMGYETFVGDMGSSLSGGQRQRVFLARALYRGPHILMLDEGTANLDSETETRVNTTLASLPITRIMIAHRPETIRNADRIITISKGRIVSDVRTRERRGHSAHNSAADNDGQQQETKASPALPDVPPLPPAEGIAEPSRRPLWAGRLK